MPTERSVSPLPFEVSGGDGEEEEEDVYKAWEEWEQGGGRVDDGFRPSSVQTTWTKALALSAVHWYQARDGDDSFDSADRSGEEESALESRASMASSAKARHESASLRQRHEVEGVGWGSGGEKLGRMLKRIFAFSGLGSKEVMSLASRMYRCPSPLPSSQASRCTLCQGHAVMAAPVLMSRNLPTPWDATGWTRRRGTP